MNTTGFKIQKMDAVIALHKGRNCVAVRALLTTLDADAKLLPMFPNASDADGQRWYLLKTFDAMQLPLLIKKIQQHADIDAAYIKPDGATPRNTF